MKKQNKSKKETEEKRFNPHSRQFAAWGYLTDHKTTEIGYGGSAYSGKSYLLCQWLTINCLLYPETAWGLGRKELKTLKKTTLITLFKVFKEYGWEGNKHYVYNQKLDVIYIYNGSRIELIDVAYLPRDPLFHRFGGLELTGLAIDESAEAPFEGIKILKTRIGRCNNEKYNLVAKLFETFNPDKGHVYFRYFKPFRDECMPSYRQFIPALPKDNPYCPPSYIQELERADKVTRERLLNGNFDYDDTDNNLFDYDAIQAIFTNSDSVTGLKYITCDAARQGSDRVVIMVWSGYRVIETIVIEKSRQNKYKRRVQDIASRIISLSAQYDIPRPSIIVDDDGVGGGVVDLIPGCVGFINGARPVKQKHVSASNKEDNEFEQFDSLKSQCVYKLAEKINAFEVFVDPKGLQSDSYREIIIEDIDAYRKRDFDKDGKLKVTKKEDIRKTLGRSPDFADAMIMRMYPELKKIMSFSEMKKHIKTFQKRVNFGEMFL